MWGLSYELLALIALALISGGIVKGITGLALPVTSLAITLNFLEPKLCISLLVLPILVTNAWQAFRTGLSLDLLMRFWLMACCLVGFLIISATIVIELEKNILFLCLGLSVAIFASSNLIKPQRQPIKKLTEKILGPIAGILGGMLGGVSTMWGPPITMFLMLLNLSKDEWIRVVSLIWFLGSIPLTIAYVNNGMLNANTVPLSIYACIPGMIGIFIGEHIRHKVPQEIFRKILLCLLFFIGLDLMRRAIF